jgi:hypothetical protein
MLTDAVCWRMLTYADVCTYIQVTELIQHFPMKKALSPEEIEKVPLIDPIKAPLRLY